MLFAFVSFVHHQQFLAGQKRSLQGDQSTVGIDLDGAGVFMKRAFTLVAVDEERNMDADAGRPSALQLPCVAFIAILCAGQFGPLQGFEDLAQGFVWSAGLPLLSKNTQERCPGRLVLGMKLLFQQTLKWMATGYHSTFDCFAGRARGDGAIRRTIAG